MFNRKGQNTVEYLIVVAAVIVIIVAVFGNKGFVKESINDSIETMVKGIEHMAGVEPLPESEQDPCRANPEACIDQDPCSQNPSLPECQNGGEEDDGDNEDPDIKCRKRENWHKPECEEWCNSHPRICSR